MNMGVSIINFTHVVAQTAITQSRIGVALSAVVSTRAKTVVATFQLASPRDTGAMIGGFRAIPHGPLEWEVVNEVRRGRFSYPSAQITGTGVQGRSVQGFTGSFNASWAGMPPHSGIRAAWIAEISKPFAVGSLF